MLLLISFLTAFAVGASLIIPSRHDDDGYDAEEF